MAKCSNPYVHTIISPDSSDPQGFVVVGAVRLIAYGLIGDDYITFKKVRYCSDNPHFKRNNCDLFEPEDPHISSATDYMIGACKPSLTADRNMIIIPYAGHYIPVIHGNESADLIVEIESMKAGKYNDTETGVNPCLPCKEVWTETGNSQCGEEFIEREEINSCTSELRWVPTDKLVEWVETGDFKCGDKFIIAEEVNQCGLTRWTETERLVNWVETGKSRCKDHVIEVEEVNQCGLTRWTKTKEICGYHATVPMPIDLGCGGCGDNYLGYIFHPEEERHPDATVEITDCDGKLYGYAYANAGEGHTLVIEECDGTVIGYCANQSPTAPQVLTCSNC